MSGKLTHEWMREILWEGMDAVLDDILKVIEGAGPSNNDSQEEDGSDDQIINDPWN